MRYNIIKKFIPGVPSPGLAVWILSFAAAAAAFCFDVSAEPVPFPEDSSYVITEEDEEGSDSVSVIDLTEIYSGADSSRAAGLRSPETYIYSSGRPGEATSGDGVSMSFTYGFKNTAKSGRLIPFDVEIVNNSPDVLNGTLVIETTGSMDDGAGAMEDASLEYQYAVSLEPGEAGNIRSTVSLSQASGIAFVRLYNESGECIAEGNAAIDLESRLNSGLLIGILSDTPEKLEYFKNISITGTGLRTATVELEPDSLPISASGYEQLDMLIVGGLDTDGISGESLRAIEQWVSSGGVIVIGTGSSTEEAEFFAGGTDELALTPLGKKTVNMGIKYSKTDDPDEAEVRISICDVFVGAGIEVMQSDDIAMLTTVQTGNGVTAILAYDPCEIADFCSDEIEYAEDILTGALGTSRLAQLAGSIYSPAEFYEEAGGLAGIADTPRTGRMGIWLTLASIYVLIIIGLCFYLRSRGLSIFYHIFVVITAFVFATAFYLTGTNLRSGGISINYASIRQISGDYSQESGFIKIVSSSSDEYRIYVPDEYEIYPIVYSPGDNALLPVDPANDNRIAIAGGEDVKVIDINADKPFAGVLSEFTRSLSPEYNDVLTADISFFDGNISLTVTNSSDLMFENAAVLLYGRVFAIGPVGPMSTVSFENAETLIYPVGNPAALAGFLVDTGANEGSDTDYVRDLRRERLLEYYLGNYLYWYFDGARIIAFAEGNEAAPGFYSDQRIRSQGGTLYAVSGDVDFSDGIYVWRNCLKNEPVVISGEYDFVTNTASGTAVLEYNLGSGISIISLKFERLSEEFASDEAVPFDGRISLYNYETAAYDNVGSGEAVLDSEEIQKYLSPGNTVTVRYSPEESSLGGAMYLPVPTVIGTEGDHNA